MRMRMRVGKEKRMRLGGREEKGKGMERMLN